jgi:hypothetical protein
MSPANAIRLEILRTAPLDKWVALSSDESRIVAVGDNFQEAADKSEVCGEADPIILKTPPSWAVISV